MQTLTSLCLRRTKLYFSIVRTATVDHSTESTELHPKNKDPHPVKMAIGISLLMLLYEMLYHPAAVSYKSSNFPRNNDISRKRPRSARTPGPAWRTKGPGMSCKGLNWNQAFQWEGELYGALPVNMALLTCSSPAERERKKTTEKRRTVPITAVAERGPTAIRWVPMSVFTTDNHTAGKRLL